ncbi:uncharacterized protein LAESUDRAFT_275400 [Laetiporus sulphureus 93-53]|uniref:Uncharacterized protein n=1 Tax=Laetiporus sulphureus 93-53 TaxID=1314785 RepID=A0A165HC00_9APHY|nr:uncharacterized protein LAESUDRAFT_275400 [Laetiporus sulphureus 93-53]KZT11529.1 hypothetical protein LAESUDRAFT_275400 [Laetiporus sulphureus 93-53]
MQNKEKLHRAIPPFCTVPKDQSPDYIKNHRNPSPMPASSIMSTLIIMHITAETGTPTIKVTENIMDSLVGVFVITPTALGAPASSDCPTYARCNFRLNLGQRFILRVLRGACRCNADVSSNLILFALRLTTFGFAHV